MDVLFLAHRVPFPPNRGDKIRGFHVLKHLAARTRVHLIAFADDPADLDPAPEFRAMLASCTIVPRRTSQAVAALKALASGRPVSLAAFDDARLWTALRGIGPVDATYIFSGQMAQYLPIDAGRTIMDFVDVDSAKFTGYATAERGPRAWMMRREARLLSAFEQDVAGRVDANLFVSNAEAALFWVGTPDARIETVENGIDTAFFDPATEFRAVDEQGPLIVFTGQMDYRPNIDAVTWFARDILPRIPAARFAIVGRAPVSSVSALASDRIIVTGAVDDVRGWLAAADVVVAPLKIARGVQNKVLEAMAMARPVVASAAAAEGIDHGGTIRVGEDAASIADHVSDLLANRDQAEALGQAARARVMARYGWDATLAPLDALLGLAA